MIRFLGSIFSQKNIVKKMLVLICGVFFAISSITAQAATLSEIEANGVMNVVTEDSYAPFEMIKDGQPTGFDHDAITALKAYAPFKINSQIMPWAGLLPAVLSGRYDIAMTGAVVTPERLQAFDFTQPIASAQHFAIIRKEEKNIKTVADLSGKTVGVQAGSAQLTKLPQLEKMLAKTGGKLGKVMQYSSYQDAYLDLANGRLDYVINAFVPAKNLTMMRPNVFKLSVPVSGEGYHAWAIPKGHKALLDYMDKFIDHLRSTGELAKLQEKWFGIAMPNLPHLPITTVAEYNKLVNAQQEMKITHVSTQQKNEFWGASEWKMLWDGTVTTVWISALSIGLGLIFGLIIAFIRTLKLPVIDRFLSLFISVVRAAPLVTVVLFLFTSVGLQLGASFTAVLALTINTSAFNAEIWRNALASFPKGQREAGLASGMTEFQVFRRIMLPQMFLTSLPALVNEMTFLVKASPAIAVIGVVDLTRETYRISATTFDPLPPILVGCVIYMVILSIMLRCQRWSERYVHRLSM